jgi:hypothetical protein
MMCRSTANIPDRSPSNHSSNVCVRAERVSTQAHGYVPIEYVIDARPPPFGDPQHFHYMISKEGGPVSPRGATAAW